MSETQSIQEPTAEQTPKAQASAEGPASAGVAAFDLSAIADAVREQGIKLAGVSLGYGQHALERSARALESAAGKLGELQGRLKGAETQASSAASSAN